jgi:aryl-alcohol dehydrogenase-like predicted oxidoreductase
MGDRLDCKASAELVACAIESGINFFDTADVYADGAGERALGMALAQHPHDAYLVGSKCFFPNKSLGSSGGLSRSHIVASVEQSLRNLRRERLDLMQCHRFDPDTPLEETISAFDSLIRAGKLRHWGVSRWSPLQLSEAQAICDATAAPRPCVNQYFYNLFSRQIETDLVPFCRETGCAIAAYSPLAQGILTGKYGGGQIPPGSRASDHSARQTMWDLQEPKLRIAARIATIASGIGVTPAQLALAWCLRHDITATVLVGASRPEQVRENAAAADLLLDEELLERVEDALRLGT